MLILGRKVEGAIIIDTGKERIRLMVTKIQHGQAFIGFDAPGHVDIIREELDDGREWRRKTAPTAPKREVEDEAGA